MDRIGSVRRGSRRPHVGNRKADAGRHGGWLQQDEHVARRARSSKEALKSAVYRLPFVEVLQGAWQGGVLHVQGHVKT